MKNLTHVNYLASGSPGAGPVSEEFSIIQSFTRAHEYGYAYALGPRERPIELLLLLNFLILSMGPARAHAQGGNLPPTAPGQARADSAASGARSKIFNSALAGPAGKRLPCSQFRTVSNGTPIRAAKAACVSPVRRRTRRVYAAASCADAASSAAALRWMAASVVASTRCWSMRPWSGLAALSVMAAFWTAAVY